MATPVESLVWSLLQQHCGIFYDKLGLSTKLSDKPALYSTSFVIGFSEQPEHFDSALALGARVRLAVDVVNACCACRGLDPARNQRFWHRVATELWTKPGGTSKFSLAKNDFQPFTADSFAHCKIVMASANTAGAREADECPLVVEAFWRSFFHSDDSLCVKQCQAKMRQVVETLAPHLAVGIRSVQIEGLVHGMDSSGPWYRNEQLTHVLHSLVRYVNEPQNSSMSFRLLACYAINSKPSIPPRSIQDMALVSGSGLRVSVEKLEVVLDHDPKSTQEIWSLVASLGELLRVIFAGGTTKSLELSTRRKDIRFVGAVLSIVPFAEALESLACNWLLRQDPNRRLHSAWLVFACFHPRRAALHSVKFASLDYVDLDEEDARHLEAIVRSRMPLREVVAAVLETRYQAHRATVQVKHFRMGNTVLVKRGTQLYYEPGRHTATYVVTTLDEDELLDIVAHVVSDGSVGVVCPGYGLLWVKQSAVTLAPREGHNSEADKRLATASLGEMVGPLAFSLHLGNSISRAHDPVTLRFFAGSSLESLDLHGVTFMQDELRKLLVTSPRLKTLKLRSCTVESIEPVVSVFANEAAECFLASLSLLDVHFSRSGQSFVPLFDALLEPTHPLSLALQELHIDLFSVEDSADVADYQQFVRLLQHQPVVRLRRVRLVVPRRLRSDHVSAQLTPLRGCLRSDLSPEIRVAMHRLLCVKVRSADLARVVMDFVSGQVEQSVGWTHSPVGSPWQL